MTVKRGHSVSRVEKGELRFSVESRILREIGERLVKQPEVALLELIKNSYDADARSCIVDASDPDLLIVTDDGHGMTIAQFKKNWMRVGTSSKASKAVSKHFKRSITGEKGIGRFAVRFLGDRLTVHSVAEDEDGRRTKLEVTFDWPALDKFEDLGMAEVPYRLSVASVDEPLGTTLRIEDLKVDIGEIDWRQIKTGSIGVVSPLRSLIDQVNPEYSPNRKFRRVVDPGFELVVQHEGDSSDETDLATEILESYVLKATLELKGSRLTVAVWERGQDEPEIYIVETIDNKVGLLRADIRFFPRRKGTFDSVPIDGRRAYGWVNENSGVAVFDRGFRVLPYGVNEDDWLLLAADAARNRREPRSSLSLKHFPMQSAEKADPKLNWMLRLPQPAQLIGIVQIRGRRSSDAGDIGLVAAADREGFVDNAAYRQLSDIVRASAELIAVADRRIQQREEERKRQHTVEQAKVKTREAIEEIESLRDIPAQQKRRLVSMLVESQQSIELQQEVSSKRHAQLEVMSLLGVIAGYMTHEFGMAIDDLTRSLGHLQQLAKRDPRFVEDAKMLSVRIDRLKEFSKYSRAYVESARHGSIASFKILPRVRRVIRLLGNYAEERSIEIENSIENDLMSPGVPVTLYDGILQNLYTNALKAVSSRRGDSARRIAFRAWNDTKHHYLQVSDTGIGIPDALQERIFEPLFSTTDMNSDPLGSGMGLGLSLIKSGAEAFGGRVELVTPPAGFSTCVQVRFPFNAEKH